MPLDNPPQLLRPSDVDFIPIVPSYVMWTDPTFATTLAIASASETVESFNGGTVIRPNFVARALAITLLARECVARIEAFSRVDLSGVFDDAGQSIGPRHFAYADAARFTTLDVAAACVQYQALLTANLTNPSGGQLIGSIAGSAGLQAGYYANAGLDGVPRFVCGAIYRNEPSGAATPPIDDATTLSGIVNGSQNDWNVMIDSGLAATCAGHLSLARGGWLEQIQTAYPGRGYT